MIRRNHYIESLIREKTNTHFQSISKLRNAAQYNWNAFRGRRFKTLDCYRGVMVVVTDCNTLEDLEDLSKKFFGDDPYKIQVVRLPATTDDYAVLDAKGSYGYIQAEVVDPSYEDFVESGMVQVKIHTPVPYAYATATCHT